MSLLRPTPRPIVHLVLCRIGLILLAAVVLQLAAASPARATPAEEAAARQLTFADAELARGEFDKALQSAESALRLDPTQYRAMAIKGLAYEGLGDLDLAESLLRAYCELSGKSPSEGEAGRALARIDARQEVARSQRRRTSSTRAADELPTLEGLRQRRERIRVYREEKAGGRAREELALLAGEHVGVWRIEREPEALFLGGWALAELGEDEGAARALELYLEKASSSGRLAEQAAAILARLRGGWDEPAAPEPERAPEPAAEPEPVPVVSTVPTVSTSPMASSASTYAVERPEPGGVLLAAGVGSAVGGVVMVLVTGAPYEAGKAEQDWPDWYRESDWASTRAVNTVGWSVLVAGAGVAAAGGLVLALAPSQSGPVSVVPTPSGVLILGVFP